RGCARCCATAPSRSPCSCSCFRFGGPASERDASPNALRQRRRPMMSNAGCWKRRLADLAIATSLLSGCATVGSEEVGPVTCLPVVKYTREFQARAADELLLLPERSVLAEMMSDYVVLREQARACRALEDRG